MSIQKQSYKSKKTGQTTVKYFANVWYAAEKRSITGPMREKEKEAKKDEVDIIRSIESGQGKARKKDRMTTLQEIYDIWHEATAPPTYANSTWRVYERFYNDYIKDVFGDMAISKIKATHMQKYVNLMKKSHSPGTVNKCINILSNLFKYAVSPLKCISSTENPMEGITRCTVPVRKKVTWSDDEIALFLRLPEIAESHYYPMLCLSALLGARPGEVCGLTETCLSDKPTYLIDFDRGYDNWECETNLKTNQSHRQPPIPKHLYELLHKRLLWKKRTRLQDKSWGDNDYLFVSQKGMPIKPHQYATGFKRLLSAYNNSCESDKDKLPFITLYGFRTSFATNNMRRFPNAALISSIMGNSPKTLIQFYTQSDTEMQKELINNYVNLERTIS